MADTSITQLAGYNPGANASASDHKNDVFVVVDVNDSSMAGSGTDKKLAVSQFTARSGVGNADPSILDIALDPVAQGDLLYRGAVNWEVLAPGTSGYLLASQGASANPHWVTNAVASISGAAPLASPTFTGTVTISTSSNLVLTDQASTAFTITTGTTYGTKIGGSTSQKIGFYNTTPVVQQTGDLLAGITNLGLFASPQITHWTGGITTINCTSALTAAIDCTSTNAFLVNLYSGGGEHTFTLTNLAVGQTVKLTVVQGTTPGTITWGGSGNQTIRWAGGSSPTLADRVATKADTIVLYSPATGVIGGGLSIANF